MSPNSSTADQSDQSQSLTDKLPLTQGGIIGVVTFVAGYLLTLVLIVVAEDSEFVDDTVSGAGQLYYNAYFADLEAIDAETGDVISQAGFNMLTDEAVKIVLSGEIELELESQVPLILYHLIPIVVLTAGGLYLARQVQAREPTTAAMAGATIVVGTIVPAALGTVVFSSTNNGVTMAPITGDSILFVGLLFPAIFGAVGGLLWTQLNQHPTQSPNSQTNSQSQEATSAPHESSQSAETTANNPDLNDYPAQVTDYLERDGWTTSKSQLREGVVAITGRSESMNGTTSLLALVITSPETEVTSEHVRYIVKKSRENDLERTLLTATVTIPADITSIAKNHDLELVLEETIVDTTGTHQPDQTDTTASNDEQSHIVGKESPPQHDHQSASQPQAATPTKEDGSGTPPHGQLHGQQPPLDSPIDILSLEPGKQAVKYSAGVFGAVGLGYGVGLLLLSTLGGLAGEIIGMAAFLIPIFGAPIIAVMTGVITSRQLRVHKYAAGVASGVGAFLGFLGLLLVLLLSSLVIGSGDGDGDLTSDLLPLVGFGLGVATSAVVTTILVHQIHFRQ